MGRVNMFKSADIYFKGKTWTEISHFFQAEISWLLIWPSRIIRHFQVFVEFRTILVRICKVFLILMRNALSQLSYTLFCLSWQFYVGNISRASPLHIRTQFWMKYDIIKYHTVLEFCYNCIVPRIILSGKYERLFCREAHLYLIFGCISHHFV